MFNDCYQIGLDRPFDQMLRLLKASFLYEPTSKATFENRVV